MAFADPTHTALVSLAAALADEPSPTGLARALGAYLRDAGVSWYYVHLRCGGRPDRLATYRCPRSRARLLETASADGPRTALDEPCLLLTAGGSGAADPVAVCAYAWPGAHPDSSEGHTVVLAVLRRIVDLACSGRQRAIVDGLLRMSPTLVYLFDAEGRALARIAPKGWNMPEPRLRLVTRRLSRQAGHRPSLVAVDDSGLYEVRSAWLPDRTGQEVLVEARWRGLGKSRPLDLPDASLLTAREQQILDLIMEGCTNRQISARLCISGDTVKTHCRHVFAKLGIARRTEFLPLCSRGALGARRAVS